MNAVTFIRRGAFGTWTPPDGKAVDSFKVIVVSMPPE